MGSNSRMTSFQRREQLIGVGRSLFASKGFESVSVEEIAAHAKVSKPIVYEHFGGKEGLYAVVVDREMRSLSETLFRALEDPSDAHPRQIVERTALALLTYIEENAEGFQVLVRDSPTDTSASFSSLWGDISLRVEDVLRIWFTRQNMPTEGVEYYAQMLVGMTVFTGQYWAMQQVMGKEELAALIVNLAWNGLAHMKAHPQLRFEDELYECGDGGNIEVVAAFGNAEHPDAKEIKRMEKAERKAAKLAEKEAKLEAKEAAREAKLLEKEAKLRAANA